MLFFNLLISSIVASASSDTQYTQSITFHSETNDRGQVVHFCNFKLEPKKDIEIVSIYESIDGKDAAVPKNTAKAVPSTTAPGFMRIDLPSDIEKNGRIYSFRFEFTDQTSTYSQKWTYDKEQKKFSLLTGVRTRWYKSKEFIIIAAIAIFILVFGLGVLLYKKFKPRKNVL